MPFTSPNEKLGVRKPGLAAIPKKPKLKKFKPAVLKAPSAPKPQTIQPSMMGLKSAALGGKPFAAGSEGF